MSSSHPEHEQTVSLGETMRAERQKQTLRVSDLASLANIPVAWLIALEEDRIEDLPATADPGTLVTAYARGLGINPNPWIDTLKTLPRRRHRFNRRNRRGMLLDDRRENFRRSLVSMAVVAILWVIYTILLNFATDNRRDGGVPTDTKQQEIHESIR